MAQFSRFNALDQILDIQGSFSQSSTRTLTDETSGFGAPLSGQTGAAATIGTSGPIATITGLTGMTANSVGNFLTITGAATGGNNGTFLIVTFNSATSVDIANATASAPDANDGAISWTERRAYSLNDDLDFERTDRAAIKGVGYDQPIPTYTRPTATGTPVAANLSNIAGKTTDARGFVFNRKFSAATVAATDTLITVTSVGNLRHADATNKTGVPMFDAAPYTGDYVACYVEILNPADGTQLEVKTGGNAGEKIYGITQAGASTSPDSIEVAFYSVPYGGDIATQSTPYTWEAGQPTSIDLFYGYFERLDQVNEYAFRTIQSLGVEENGDLRQDINDIQQVIGMSDGNTFLTGLTNTGNFFPFVNLPDGTPSVTEALNTLNAQIGNRDYTGPYLTDGQTITASLQALQVAISASSVVRYIERLGADINANTAHTLPGGATYTLDGTNNGLNLWVYTRGVLRDPGSIVSGNDYAETSTTQVTFYAKQKAGDHINYMVLA
jgi:hypothetical protein